MKKFTKTCLILAAVFMALGIIGCVTGAVMGAGYYNVSEIIKDHVGENDIVINGWKNSGDKKLKNASPSENSFDASSIQNLSIDLQYGHLTFKPTDGSDIVVKVRKNDGHFVSKTEGDTLMLTDERTTKNGHAGYEVTVLIPQGKTFADVDIETNAGTFDANQILLVANELSITVDAGQAILGTVTAQDADFETGAGDIQISCIDATDISVDCGVGNVDIGLAKTAAEYDFSLDCSVGNIDIDSLGISGFQSQKEIDNNAGRSVYLTCGVGNITVKTAQGTSTENVL